MLAVLATELAGCLAGDWKRWRYVLAEVGVAAVLLFAKGACMDYIMEDMGLDFNPEIEASWQNYFYMGLNEESTGSYHAGDAAIFGEFQTSREVRNEAALERAFGRIKERGFLGSIYFWLRKMVMVFNDGTFGWESEVRIYGHYSADLTSNSRLTELLRNIFWPDSLYTGRFSAFCQLAWVFCMLGISGICFCRGEKSEEGISVKEKYAVLVVSFLGIFFYQMLFEARARYLLVFFPLLCVMSICGIWQYVDRIHGWIQKHVTEKRLSVNGITKKDAPDRGEEWKKWKKIKGCVPENISK